jgi:hypothetical protein
MFLPYHRMILTQVRPLHLEHRILFVTGLGHDPPPVTGEQPVFPLLYQHLIGVLYCGGRDGDVRNGGMKGWRRDGGVEMGWRGDEKERLGREK